MSYQAEVTDVGGCSVGTAVFTTTTLTRAVQWIADTTKQAWAGSWVIVDCDTDDVLLEGRTGA